MRVLPLDDISPLTRRSALYLLLNIIMEYIPITQLSAEKQNEWFVWLKNQKELLNDRKEVKSESYIFYTPDGDVATAKDLVGNLLALLTNLPVTID